MDQEYPHPESYEAIAMDALNRAHWLDQSRHAVKIESIHGAPPDMTDEVKAQREALLSLAEKILVNARNRAMDEAVGYWEAYRERTQ